MSIPSHKWCFLMHCFISPPPKDIHINMVYKWKKQVIHIVLGLKQSLLLVFLAIIAWKITSISISLSKQVGILRNRLDAGSDLKNIIVLSLLLNIQLTLYVFILLLHFQYHNFGFAHFKIVVFNLKDPSRWTAMSFMRTIWGSCTALTRALAPQHSMKRTLMHRYALCSKIHLISHFRCIIWLQWT